MALPATFILRRNAGAWSIVFYLNHYDIIAVLRERGLLPPATV